MVKRLPTVRETRVRSLGWEDPLEEEMVTHSSILAQGIPWTEEPGSLQSLGLQSRTQLYLHTHTHTHTHSLSLSLSLSVSGLLAPEAYLSSNPGTS